jgi:hypothetical protein
MSRPVKIFSRHFCVLAVLVVLPFGCRKPSPPPHPLPAITAFSVSPATIARGSTASLSWSVSGASSLSIDQGVGEVTSSSADVTPSSTTTFTLTATNENGAVSATATVTVPDPSMLLTGIAAGSSMLGELSDLPLNATAPATSFHAFAGTPWIDDALPDGSGLVWNAIDHSFYGVLNGGGAFATGVVVRFDPTTSTLTMLKTLSGRAFPDAVGLTGEALPFNRATGFYRTPLLTLDGKGLLLLSTNGGVAERGLLIHLDLDPASPTYLHDTVVYDFFDFERAQNDACLGLRAPTPGDQTELTWGKSPSGEDVVFMARSGLSYDPTSGADPSLSGNCHRTTSPTGNHVDEIRGRLFALKPTDPSHPAAPWTYAFGYTSDDHTGNSIDPLLNLGRQIAWDSAKQATRWSTENPGGGALMFYESGVASGTTLYRGDSSACEHLNGVLALDTSGNALATCSGLYFGVTNPGGDLASRLFELTAAGSFVEKAVFDGWSSRANSMRGATTSLAARRVFVNGGYFDDQCFSDQFGCVSPSTIEELNPLNGFSSQVLVTGDKATTGQFFLGDPAVGDAPGAPARYLAWFGAEVNGHSNVLNAYDRSTGKTVTLPLDPVAGAHPLGRLLDLGNGTALGLMNRTPPDRSATEVDLPGGYAGNGIVPGSFPGYYLLDLTTHAVRKTFPIRPMRDRSLEHVLDDGSVWEAVSYFASGYGNYRNLSQLDLSTGALSDLYEKQEDWNYAPADPFTLAGRKGVLYVPFWDSSVTPASKRAANVTIACARPGAGTGATHSLPFGPAQASSGNAHRIVYGATYSPANDAMYLATAKVADADLGTIFEIDKGIADADLCKASPQVKALVTGLTDVPSTRPFSSRAGALFYGTANGKLMRLDPAGAAVMPVADLSATSPATSAVRGYLAETTDGVVVAVVYDYDATGRNTARRLVSVVVATGATTSRDVTALIDESEPYPGVMPLN